MTGRDLCWFIIGTLGGWLIIGLAMALLGAGLGVLTAAFIVGFPVFAVIGFVWCVRHIGSTKKDANIEE